MYLGGIQVNPEQKAYSITVISSCFVEVIKAGSSSRGEEFGICFWTGGNGKELMEGISKSASPASRGPGFRVGAGVSCSSQFCTSCLMGILIWKWGPGSHTSNVCCRSMTTSPLQTGSHLKCHTTANSSSVIKMGQPGK